MPPPLFLTLTVPVHWQDVCRALQHVIAAPSLLFILSIHHPFRSLFWVARSRVLLGPLGSCLPSLAAACHRRRHIRSHHWDCLVCRSKIHFSLFVYAFSEMLAWSALLVAYL
ncbi:hypothetical protein B0H10DRAFT_153420 [Mycena sp. CBHHK59/15]|nr:hypothetical protein B0H10DRAFT_153420 [Mycena sp. CBHHK59/15]